MEFPVNKIYENFQSLEGEYELAVHPVNNELLQNILSECLEYILENEKLEEKKEKNKKNNKKWRRKNEEKRKEYNKRWHKNKEEWYKKNPEKSKERKEKQKQWKSSYTSFKVYAHQLTIEEDPKNDGNGKLLVSCAYCGKYFHPIVETVVRRIGSLLGYNHGESRLYCSDGCKDACPIFHQSKWPKGFKPASSREVDPLIRQMCLKRDNYECQRCGATTDEAELHAHHIEGVVQQPLLANDIDNTITLCKKCHRWVHKQKGCTYYDLRCKK